MTTRERAVADAGHAEFSQLLYAGDWRSARDAALRGVADSDSSPARLHWMADNAFAEWAGGDAEAALAILTGAATLYDREQSDFIRGVYESARAVTLEALERFDEAFEWYAGALAHFESVGCEEYAAATASNLGLLLVKSKRAADALEYLYRAEAVYRRLGDDAKLAEVYENLMLARRARATPV